MNAALQVLTLPGWQGAGADHWLTRWERQAGFRRVEQSDWHWPRRGDWMARLDDSLLAADDPSAVVLVAHGLGCQLVAAWAAHTRQAAQVAAALLVAPCDTEAADAAPQLYSWRPMVRQALPFASTVVASRNDPRCSLARAGELAAAWGSVWTVTDDRDRLDSPPACSDWPAGHMLLDALTACVSRPRESDSLPAPAAVAAGYRQTENRRPDGVTS